MARRGKPGIRGVRFQWATSHNEVAELAPVPLPPGGGAAAGPARAAESQARRHCGPNTALSTAVAGLSSACSPAGFGWWDSASACALLISV